MSLYDRKRMHHRLRLEQVINLHKTSKTDEITTTADVHIRNVSVGGAFLETQELFPINSKVEFAIKIPSVQYEIPVYAIVRHVETTPLAGMGVEFLSISPGHLMALTQYIKEYNSDLE